VDRLTGGFRPYFLLSLLCLSLYLPGLWSVPPLDRDEARFIQSTRQMLESGDFIRIQFQDEMRAKKPVGAYWAQAASVVFFADSTTREVWPYRMPSLLAAWAASLITFAFGRRLFAPETALLGAALLGSCLILVSEAHQAKTDAILLLCSVTAQAVLSRFYLDDRRGRPDPGARAALLFWVAIGAALLVKGPVVPAIVLLCIVTLLVIDRGRGAAWLSNLRPVTGIAIAVLIAGPWYLAVSKATGGAFVAEAVQGDLLPKLLGAQENHGAWPGTFLLLAPVLLWPASLQLLPAMVWTWRERARDEIRLCLAWIIPAWLMFELVPTKLPHYVLPTFPAIALLIAAAAASRSDDLCGRAARIWYAAWSAIPIALAIAVLVAPVRFGDRFDLTSVPAFLSIAATGLLSAWLALRGRTLGAAFAVLVTAGTTFPVVFEGVLPQLNQLWVARSAAELVATRPHEGPVAIAGFSEPSAVFLLGTDTRLTTASEVASILATRPHALVLVSDREEEAFRAAGITRGISPVAVGKVRGFNYSRGQAIVLTAYQLEDGS
jgi:4-amino-4-deoxy-L-arabinose transferase-like glycosyltransferase